VGGSGGIGLRKEDPTQGLMPAGLEGGRRIGRDDPAQFLGGRASQNRIPGRDRDLDLGRQS